MATKLATQWLTLFRVDLPADPKKGQPARSFWSGRLHAPFGDAEFTSYGLVAVAGVLADLKVGDGTAANGRPFIHLGVVDAEVEPVGEPTKFLRADGTEGTSVPVCLTALKRGEDTVTSALDALLTPKA